MTKGARQRLTIVSGYGNRSLTPRGQRTQRVAAELSRDWDVDVIALPPERDPRRIGGASPPSSGLRKTAKKAVLSVLLDRREPWAARRLRDWAPAVDAALLIATPWSPVVYASRRLAAAGVPYVIDTGDPWVLTADYELKGPWVRRARRAERVAWAGAVGGVVTTRGQHNDLRAEFPGLPILIRPNGYEPSDVAAVAPSPAPGRDRSRLRLAHFGMLNPRRVDIAPTLEQLLAGGRWNSIEFAQYGEDYESSLDRAPAGIEIQRHPARPWAEVIELAPEYDAAIVVGNPLSHLLPSKAVQYLTLPIPRIVLTNSDPDDALREFAAGRPGWLVLSERDVEADAQIWDLVGRPWSAAELRAPQEEAWPRVARQIADFVEDCVGSAGEGTAVAGARQRTSVPGSGS